MIGLDWSKYKVYVAVCEWLGVLDIELFNLTFVHDFEDLILLEVKPGSIINFEIFTLKRNILSTCICFEHRWFTAFLYNCFRNREYCKTCGHKEDPNVVLNCLQDMVIFCFSGHSYFLQDIIGV
jgi:hypothetical protein